MNAEIIAVGTELLMGQISNTNAQFLSEQLNRIGINVYYHNVVGDNLNRIKETIDISSKRSDIIIFTGGLGPTLDDLTKEAIAQYLNKNLLPDEKSIADIKKYFTLHKKEMSANNLRQGYFPEDSIIVGNSKGTAPSCIIETSNKIYILLPGPPKELKPMFINEILPYITKKSDKKMQSKFIRIFGIGESIVEDKLMTQIQNQTNPTIATYAKDGEVLIRVTASGDTDEIVEQKLLPIITKIHNIFGDDIINDENIEMAEYVAKLLIKNKITCSFAESCTGGMLASTIIGIAGTSNILERSIITYSNQAKMDELDVKETTLKKYTAISKETALEMATGIRKKASTQLGLSITGLAGPGGGTDEKPIGLVYIGLSYKEQLICKELRLNGDRTKIRTLSTLHALDFIRRTILSGKDAETI